MKVCVWTVKVKETSAKEQGKKRHSSSHFSLRGRDDIIIICRKAPLARIYSRRAFSESDVTSVSLRLLFVLLFVCHVNDRGMSETCHETDKTSNCSWSPFSSNCSSKREEDQLLSPFFFTCFKTEGMKQGMRRQTCYSPILVPVVVCNVPGINVNCPF